MTEPIFFFRSGNSSENKAAQDALLKLGFLNITTINNYYAFAGKVKLPFIQTLDGQRVFGVDAIELFVNNHLQ